MSDEYGAQAKPITEVCAEIIFILDQAKQLRSAYAFADSPGAFQDTADAIAQLGSQLLDRASTIRAAVEELDHKTRRRPYLGPPLTRQEIILNAQEEGVEYLPSPVSEGFYRLGKDAFGRSEPDPESPNFQLQAYAHLAKFFSLLPRDILKEAYCIDDPEERGKFIHDQLVSFAKEEPPST